MAPKNLLKQVFRNIIHQKSLETMHLPVEQERSGRQQTPTTEERPQTAPLERTNSWVEEQSGLNTIDEASNSSGMSTAGDRREKEMDAHLPESEVTEHFARVLQLSETMTASHIDTIETALTLLHALEQLSPHVGALRKEMLEKKQWCEKQLRELQKAQAMNG